MKIVGIVQPTYLPWLPFFERMAQADVFVYLDDVQYSKNNWHNRNAIKGFQQPRTVLTVPVKYRGHAGALINEIEIDNSRDWPKKHRRTIESCYRGARFFSRYASALAQIYAESYQRLIEVQLPFIELMKNELGITTHCVRSSELNVPGERNEKLVHICKQLGGTHFIVKPGTEDYHPPEEFEPFGIQLLRWQPRNETYPQLHGAFEPYLSALDYLLNCGPANLMERVTRQSVAATL